MVLLDQWMYWETGSGRCSSVTPLLSFSFKDIFVFQMQELEQRVIEADQRADTAEKQVFISSTTGDAGTKGIF